MAKVPKNSKSQNISKPLKRRKQKLKTDSNETKVNNSNNKKRAIGKLLAATGVLGTTIAGGTWLLNSDDVRQIDLPEKTPIVRQEGSTPKPSITKKDHDPIVMDRMTITGNAKKTDPSTSTPKKELEPRSISLDVNPLDAAEQETIGSLLQSAVGIVLDNQDLDQKTKHVQITIVVADDARKEFAQTVMKLDDQKLKEAMLQNVQNLGNVDAFTINMNNKMGGEAGDTSFVYVSRSVFAQDDIYTALGKAVAVIDHELRHIARNQQGKSSINTITEEFETFSESVKSLELLSDRLLKEEDPIMKKLALAIKTKILPTEQRMLETWEARYQNR
jgi:hypothetical protein